MRIEYESNEIPVYRTITEDDNSDTDIETTLKDIADNLGYFFYAEDNNKGTISITDDVNIVVRFTNKVTSIEVTIGKNKNKQPTYKITKSNSSIDEISVALQTASMVCAEIRKRLL